MNRLTKLIDGGLRRLDQERLIRASGYFDPEWYARTYPGTGGPGRALGHYLETGAVLGNNPGPKFSSAAYLAANPDVREAGLNPLVHYLRFGRDEGRGTEDPDTGKAEPLGPAAMERITEAFDPGFYLATNPDLEAGCAPLDHFLGAGWTERRDPCPWFSVDYYLARHPDVQDTGKNPFVHYLLWGCREGREIRASRKRRLTASESATGRPRLSALVMVRNEADIIHAFAGHLLALFDDVVFVDHMSDDGTAGFLRALARENRRVSVLKLEVPAYIQSVAMTHVLRETDVLREADWVFPLDADEFLPFADGASLRDALSRYARCPVIGMRWRNLVPENYWTGPVGLTPDIRFLEPPEASPFRKVAFQPKKLSLGRTIVAQGNHALVETRNGFEVPCFDADFPLLHLPVRSVNQFVLKLNQGVEAYRRLGQGRDAAHGTHWDQMMRATAGGEITPELLNAVVVRYSEDKPELAPVTSRELVKAGHKVTRFDLAVADIGVPQPDLRPLGEMLMRIHAASTPDAEVPDNPSATRLVIEGDTLRRARHDPGVEYGPLPVTGPGNDGRRLEIPALMGRFLASSYRDIADLVPSPEVGHIPFLFTLTDIARPRRYVELGTLQGSGFLAVCQAAQQSGWAMEALAVSGWSVGAEHEAAYRNAFQIFTFLARKYADFAGYLRKSPEEAAIRFADGSIDILHLDGFCEEAPLRQSLDLWLPKLSDRGILLMHDTIAHGDDFGVWRVWEDLAGRFSSFEFPHAEGLGVACVGESAAPEVVALCEAARDDRHVRLMLRQHFEELGKLSAELFSRRYDMANGEARARAEGAEAEELSWLRQELASLRSDNDQLRGLLKGRIGHAFTG